MTKGINENINQTSAKYNIIASFTVNGVVEVQDVVGALFGQTEGLLNDLELRELQKSGRIGRIVVTADSQEGITTGDIIIPSSLDRTETAILAATLETVDRVGPCNASLYLKEIRDLRESKLKQIERRAKELLKDWKAESADRENISHKINQELERESIITWNGLPAGSDIEEADRVIIVEGRNDIQQLLKIGVKNTIAVNGTSVPKAIIDLTKRKECIAFLDGDRGGDIILNELLQVSDIKYYARAPLNREVEELSPKELVKCIQQKRPIEHLYKQRRMKKHPDTKKKPERSRETYTKPRTPHPQQNRNHRSQDTRKKPEYGRKGRTQRPQNKRPTSRRPRSSHDRKNPALERLPKDKITPIVKNLISSNEVVVLNNNFDEIHRTSNVSVFNEMDSTYNTIIIDGVVTQSFLDKAIENQVKRVIAVNIKRNLEVKNPNAIELFYFADFV